MVTPYTMQALGSFMKIIADCRVTGAWVIDLFTVYDAILAGGQTRVKLQWMYGISAHLEPL